MWHSFFNWFVKFTGFPLYFLVARPKFYYEDKSVQSRRIRGKAIVISNHTSVWDIGFMIFVFPFRTLRCIIADIMYQKNPVLTLFLKSIGGIKVEREAHNFAFIQKSCDILDKGGVIEIYPEARIPLKSEETPLEFKPSAVYIAATSGAPIIPVYIDGKYFAKERACAIIGKPIDVSSLYDHSLSEHENIKIITEKLRDKVVELKNELNSRKNKEQGK